MTSTHRATRRRTAGAAAPSMRLVPVARHGRTGLLRTTALQAVALFGLAAVAAAPHAAAQPAPNARPQGGAVVGGSAVIAQSPTRTTVTQSSPRAAVDWTSFDVGSKQTVTFTAPSPSDVTLSQVTGPDPSQIAGHVVANDQLVLVNRSGVVFSKGAEVDTAGLVVSASGIAAGAFMQGGATFDLAPRPGAKIENHGRITVKDSGLAALVAPQVANDGTITARMGHVTLAGAEAHTIDLYGDGMLSINVTKQVTKASLGGQQVDALVTNSGVVRADGGTVTLTAQAVDGLVTTLVSAGGKISADTVGGRAGTVLIDGVGGSVRVTGQVSAQGLGAGAQGGLIEVNASQIASVAAGASLNASGSGGGGTIAVGTTLARAQGGPSVKPAMTARGALVEKGATLSADATGSGKGGRITVLSTQATVFAGAITARGGAEAGDGGRAEVSGGAGFVLTGSADLRAAHGAKGSLLLDPTDLEIVATAGNDDSKIGLSGSLELLPATAADGTPLPSTVDAVKLQQLGALADIVLQASKTLTVTAPVSLSNSLTLQAGDTLTVNAGAVISARTVTLSAATTAITGATTTGALTLNAAVHAVGGGVVLSAGTNGVTLNSAITASGVTVTTTGKVTLGAGSTISVVGVGIVDVSSTGVTQDPTSAITAGVLQSTSGITGPASFAGTANAISALGNIALTNGDFTLVNAAPLTVQGGVVLGGGESVGGNIRLSVGTGKGEALTIGSTTLAGALEVANGYTISLSADVIAGVAGKASVGTVGGLIELAPLTAGRNVSINGTTAGALDLSLASLGLADGGGTLRIGAANGVTTAKNISFDAATDVSALGTLDLEASAAVSEAAGAALTAATLTGTVGSLSLPNAANSINTLTAFTASGDIALTQAASLLTFGTISGASIDLTVTQTGGAITLGGGQGEVAHLVAATGGTISLTSDLLRSNFGATATAPGGLVQIAPFNSEDVVVGSSGATIELPAISAATVQIGTVAKALTITFTDTADVGAATLDLETSGVATQTSDGGVTAAGLTGTVGSLDFASPGATDHIGGIGPFTATTGGIALTTSGNLAATGAIAALQGDVALSAPGSAITQSSGSISASPTSGKLTLTADAGISFGGKLSAQTVTLSASGATITESPAGTSTGVVDAGTLSFAAGGFATFATPSGTGSGNQVGTLGPATATQSIVFVDGQSLSLAGATQAANIRIAVDVAAGVLKLGNVSAASLTVGVGGTLSLIADQLAAPVTASPSLSAPDGVIEIAPFSPGVSISVGGASGPGVLGFETTGLPGALTLGLGSIGTLRLGEAAGASTAGPIGFVAPLDLSSGSHTLDLEATGAVTQTAAGAINVANLTGKALSVDLATATTNNVGTLLGFTAAGGSFKLVDSVPLDVAGTVTAGASAADVIALTVAQAGGTITLGTNNGVAGALIATGGASVTLQSDVLALASGGGSVSAPGATVSIAPFSTTAMVVGGPSSTVDLPILTLATLTLGKVGATTTATDITLTGGVSIGTSTLDLEGGGAATQGAGVTAGTLIGNVGTLTFDSNANAIGVVGPLAATKGDISLLDTSPIALVGNVTAVDGGVGLTTTGGSITQASGLVAGAEDGLVTLQASGSVLFGGTISGGSVVLHATGGKVSESPAGGPDTGVVRAAELRALAGAGAIDLTTPSPAGAGNQVASLGDSTATGGAFSLLDGRALTVLGAVSGTNASVAVAPGATITFGAPLVAGSLSSSPGGVVSVKADGIVETGLGGSLSAPGGGTVEITPATIGDAIAVGGASAPGTLGISLTALNFTTGANGTLRLGAAGGVTTAGAITFVAATDLTAVGTLDLEAGGAIAQTAASPLTVAALTGTAASVDLSTAAKNAIGALGGFTATGGGFKLSDASSLVVSGTVTAGAAAADQIALTVTRAGGSITLGSGSAPGLLTATGGAGVALQADQVLLGSMGGAISAPGANVAIAPYDAVAMVVGGGAATVQLPTLAATTLTLGKVGAATTATDISLAGGLSLGATALDLEASGAVSQGAAVTASALTGTVGSLTLGSVANAIGSIGKLTTTTGALIFADGRSLAFGGPLTAKTSVTLTAKAGGGTAGDIALTQAITAGTEISLSSDGQITQAGGALTAGSLSADAAGGQVLLNGTNNAVGVLRASSASGAFAFEDDSALVVNGAVSGASVTLTVNAAGQALTLGGAAGNPAALTATAATHPTVTLQADLVSLGAAGGSVTATDVAGDGLVQIAPFTPGIAFGTGPAPLQLPTFTTNTLRVGEIGTVTTAASILFGSPVVATGGTIDVEASGLVSQTASGGVTAAVLVGNVGTLDFLSAGAVNMIGALGAITATSGEIAVGDALDIKISQSISAPSILLTTGGVITQTAGTITATAANGSVDLTAGGTLSIGGVIVAPNVGLTSVLADVTETLPGQMAATGVIRTTLLTGSSGGATLLDAPSPAGAGNQVAQLGSFAAKGALTLADGEALTLVGDASGAAVTLTVNGGGIAQDAGTSLTAVGSTALTSSAGIAFGGVIGGASVSLVASGGDVAEASTGALDAGLLTGSASGAASLGGAGNMVAQLGGFSAQGAFTLVDGEALAIVGNVASGADVNITTDAGGITQALATTIGAVGSISLTSALGIAFGGTLDPTAVNLVALDGDITETLPGQPGPTGVILTPLLTGSAANGSALLNTASPAGAGNQVAQLGGFAVQGAFVLLDGEALAVVGDVSGASAALTVSGGGITQAPATSISASGSIDFASSAGIAFGGVLAGGSVSLVAQGGDVTEALGQAAPTGVIQTALLIGSASGAALLTTPSPAGAGNQVAQLGAFATAGALTLLDGESLAVAGVASSSAGDVALTANGPAADITVTSEVSAFGAATLTAGRGIGVSGTVQAGTDATLTATAGDITQSGVVTAGAAAALGAGGSIVSSGTVQAGTVATLAATAGDVTQSGLVTAPSLSETAGGSIDDSGLSIATGGSATLTASGTIAQTAGTIMATGGGVTLTAGGGEITQGAGALIADASAGQTVALTAASGIAFGGTISAAGTASLVAQGGDVAETGGVVLANLLTGSATGQALFATPSPAGSGNLVAQLGAFAAGGDLTMLDGESLTVAANLSSATGSVALTASGALSQGAGLVVSAPSGAIDLTASSDVAFAGTLAAPAVGLVSTGGNVTEALGQAAPTGVIQTALLTGSASGAALLTTPSPAGAGNQVAQLGAFATGGALTLLDGESLAVVGIASSSAGDVALTANGPAADITVTSTVSAFGAATLTAGRGIAVDGTVQAGTVATLAATAGDVTQSGLVTAPSLSETAGGSIDDSGLSIATGGSATLTASGTIAQTAGTITATGGGVTLTAGGGAITQGAGALIADASAGQTVALTAASGIAFGGTISAAGTASLVAQGGDVAETGGVVLANLLTGSATGQALFATLSPAGSGNLVAQLGNFTTGGSFTLADGEALTLVGTLDTPGGFSLTTGVGDFTQAAGTTITAPGAGAVIAIDSAGGIAFGGTLSAAAGTVSLIARDGDVTETAPGGAAPTGVVIAQSLTGSASGQALFDTPSAAGAGNLVANFGPFATSGGLVLLDGQSLTVVNTVTSSAGDVTLTAAGPGSDLTVTGTVTAASSALLTAGRAIESAGTIQGSDVSLLAGAGITQASGLILGGNGGTTLTASGGSISQAPGAVISDPPATISLAASGGIAFGGTITTAGAVSLTASGGDVTEVAPGAAAPTGVLFTFSLTGSAAGQALLSTPSPAGSGNLLAGLGGFATGGDFTLVDGQGLTVFGPLTAAAGVTPGAVTITLNGPGSDLVLQGAVTAAGAVALTAGGAISQTSGTLLATDGAITLAALGGDVAQSAGAVVSDTSAGAVISLTASGGIAFGGTITTPGTVSLVAQGGDVTEIGPQPSTSMFDDEVTAAATPQPAPTGVVIAGLLTGSASGQGLFTTPSPVGGGNEVAAIGPFTTGGSLTLLDGRSLTVSGAVASTDGDVALTVNGVASDLTVASSISAAGAATLLAGGGISQPSGTIMAAGGVSLTAMGGSVTQNAGAVVDETGAGQPVSVVASGGIAFGGLIRTPGAVTLTAQGGDVVETFGGAGPTGMLVASILSGSASGRALFDTASPGGGGNRVGTLGSFAAGGDFVLLDGATLAVAGPVTAAAGATPGVVTIGVGGAANSLTLAGDVTAAGAAAFSAGAGITQSSGVIQAGGATLTFTAQGGSITQAAGATFNAPAAGAAIVLSASDAITFGGVIAAPGSVSLVAAGGDATETGGVVRTALLTGAVHGQASLGTPSPAGSGNLIAQLGAFTAGGDLVLADGETLIASGGQSAANVSLTVAGSFAQSPGGTMAAAGTLSATAAGGIGFAGVLSAPTASLVSQGGSIVEAATGVAQFGTLSGSAAGDVSLAAPSGPGAGNQIGQVDGLSAGGSVALQDGESLTVAGAVAAQNGTATIAVHGADLTVAGSVAATGAAALSADGKLTQAGAVTGTSLSETAGGDIDHSGTSTATSGDAVLTARGAIVQPGGSISATLGNLALTAGGPGGIAFGGTLSAAQTATLTATAGGISETAPGAASPTGTLSARVLTGSAAGGFALNGPNNQIGQVSAFSASGSLTLANAAAFTVSGALSVPGGSVSLTAGGAGLTVAGAVSAASADLVATAGDVTESGTGVLSVARLSGSAAGSAAFGNANQVGSLGPFATGSGFSLTDAGPLSVTAAVSAAQGRVAIAAAGGLTQTAGTITAGGGGSAVTLTSAGGFTQVAGAAISDQDPAGGVTVTAQRITLGGTISAAGAPVTLTAKGGAVAEVDGGFIRAGSLAGSATGSATFGDEASNEVARLGGFTSGGAFQLLDGTGLTVSGPLAGQTVDIETPGVVTLSGGRISASFVPGGSQYAAVLATFGTGSGAADGIYIKAADVTQTGITMIDPGAPVRINPAVVANALTPGPVLMIDLAGGKGAIQFAALDAPAVQLFTSIGDGTESGAIDVAGLHVATSEAAGGGATLTGIVAGQVGTSAAGVADILPLRNSRYEINSCPLGSVNCILLSPILVPVSNPVQDVEVSGVGTRQDDPDLILPNVGEQDF